MTVSGSVDFNMNRDDIVSHAYTLLGVKGVGRALAPEQAAIGNLELNLLVKRWQAKGYSIFGKEEGVLFLQKDLEEYSIGPNSSDSRATKWSDAVITELSVVSAALDTTLDVDDTTGMVAADIIGIVLDVGTIHWTTIVSVDSSTTLTITTGVASEAAINSNVYTFTTRVNKPLKIHQARRSSGGTNDNVTYTVLNRISHEEYYEQSSLVNEGAPVQYHYHPELTTGRLYLWPRPENVDVFLRFTYSRQLDDMDNSSDTTPFPAEWLSAIIYQLAISLANSSQRQDQASLLVAQASSFLEEALEFDVEDTPIFIVPGVNR